MSKKVISSVLIVSIMIFGFILSPGISAKSKKSTKGPICEQTAKKMHSACKADSRDDLNTVVANCLNILDGDESKACMDEARAEKKEADQTCKDVRAARKDACEILAEEVYDPDPLLDPAIVFIDPDEVPDKYARNPYVSIAAGHTYVLRVSEEEEEEEIVVVHVTEDTRKIQGVLCRVVVDVALQAEEGDGEVEYTVLEATDDLFAQDVTGNVYYCGEVSRNFEDGVLRDLDGSFESGIEFAKAGVLIRAFPVAGDAHRQEFSLGEAEDIVQYVDLATSPTEDEGGENEAFPCNDDDDDDDDDGGCLKTLDFAPIEPESTEFKYYLPGTGFVLAVAMEDEEVTGEREVLVCIGDSLDILQYDPDCGIDDPEALLEELCKISPDAFCAD